MKTRWWSTGTRIAKRVWPLVLLIVVLWVVRYARSGEFGFYEDDFTFLPPPVQMTPSELVGFTTRFFLVFMQGTPFKLPLVYGLAHLGWGLGGLRGLYALGFGIIALNVALFYLLMERLRGPQFATLSGLAYVLYSADTTQAFLTHSFLLQTSLTMLLVALLVFRGRARPLAYLLMVVALLTYETTYLVFVAAPLLTWPRGQHWRKELIQHFVLCVLLFMGVVALRLSVGESRTATLALSDMIFVPVTHAIVGPLVALGTYVYRPIQAFLSLRSDVYLVSFVLAIVFGWVMLKMNPAGAISLWGMGGRFRVVRATQGVWPRLSPELKSILQLALAGSVMLILAYPITFTVRPYAISGRDTRVHSAGVVGASIVGGSVLALIFGVSEDYRRRGWAVSALAVGMGLLAGYGLVIQDDYARAWRLQKQFWTDLVPLIPDVGNGSAVLVDPEGLEDTRQIGANYWNLPRVLSQVFLFPATWEAVPRVYRLADGWESRILGDDGRIRLDASTTLAPPSSYTEVSRDRIIFVRYQGVVLERASVSFPPGDEDTPLSSPGGGGEPPYPHGLLYDLLIDPSVVASDGG